jgi:hypothetical protein
MWNGVSANQRGINNPGRRVFQKEWHAEKQQCTIGTVKATVVTPQLSDILRMSLPASVLIFECLPAAIFSFFYKLVSEQPDKDNPQTKGSTL